MAVIELTYFNNLPTMTMIILYMLDFDKKVIKSIVIFSYWNSTMGSVIVLSIVVALPQLVGTQDKSVRGALCHFIYRTNCRCSINHVMWHFPGCPSSDMLWIFCGYLS